MFQINVEELTHLSKIFKHNKMHMELENAETTQSGKEELPPSLFML